MSMTPAFSPGPWMTHDAFVGSVRRWIFEDLYEQCSFHIAEKMPSSVKLGVRPISSRTRSYSCGVRPWAAMTAGVILGAAAPGDFVFAGRDTILRDFGFAFLTGLFFLRAGGRAALPVGLLRALRGVFAIRPKCH